MATTMALPISRRKARVAVVDDHRLFAQSLVVALSTSGYDARHVGAGDHRGARQPVGATGRWTPDVVLLGLHLGALGDASRTIARIVHAGAVVVMLTDSTDPSVHGRCLAAGAAAVLLKSGSLATTRSAIRRAVARRPIIGWAERDSLIRRWQADRLAAAATRQHIGLLTEAEKEVLADLMEGHQVAEIAQHRGVSETTVRWQVKRVLAKLEVSSQLAAVALAHRAGWEPAELEEQVG